MKKKVMIICEMIVVLIIILSVKVYASNSYTEDYTNRHLYVTIDNDSYDYVASANINNMKMTQDDNSFYIRFDIDYVCPSLTYDRNKVIGEAKERGAKENKWDMVQEAGFGSLFVSECPNYGVHNYVKRKYDGGLNTGKTNYVGHLLLDGKYSEWDYDNGYNYDGNYSKVYKWNGNTYYIFPNIFFNDGSDCNTYYTNGNYISFSIACDFGVNYWKYNVTGTICIKKSDITHYKYLNLYSPYAVKTRMSYYSFISLENNNDTGNYQYTGYGLYATPIDISEYLFCEHEWELIHTGDKVNHKKHCKNCEWTITEPHELIGEYDGIENNMCVCGYKEKLKYEIVINDDNIATLSYIVDSYGTLPEIPTPHKTGYNFDYFEKYELYADGEKLVATCSTIELNTDNYSTTYKAHFSPIHYTFHYSNENNLGLVFEENVNSSYFEYDVATKLPPHIHKDGYIFEGWTYATTSDIIIYTDEAEVKNHTTLDMEVFTLYPRYRVLDFYILYKVSAGKYENGLDTYKKKYSYFDDSKLEIPSPYYNHIFFRFFTTNIDDIGVPDLSENETDYHIYKKMTEVKKLLAERECDFVILYAHLASSGIGTSERTMDDKSNIDGKENQELVNMIENVAKSDNIEFSYFEKTYKKDAETEKIDVFDLSQTIFEKFEKFALKISSPSYIVKYNDNKVDMDMIIFCFKNFVMEHLVELILSLIILLIIAFYVFIN